MPSFVSLDKLASIVDKPLETIMTKEDLIFRLETLKGQLQTYESSLRRSLRTGKLDKSAIEREVSRIRQNYEPLKDYITYFAGSHHFLTGLRTEVPPEPALNSIISCIRDVSMTSAQIARMSDRKFEGFMKKIEYSMYQQMEEVGEEAEATAAVNSQTRDEKPVRPTNRRDRMTWRTYEEPRQSRRLVVSLMVVTVAFGLFGIILAIYLSLDHVDSLNSIKNDIAEMRRQNTTTIGEVVSSIEGQRGLMDAVGQDVEQTAERSSEMLERLETSLSDLEKSFRGIGQSQLEGRVYVPLKAGTINVVLEIDPFEKKGFLKGRDYRTGEELLKRLDPATTNLLIWELNELKYEMD